MNQWKSVVARAYYLESFLSNPSCFEMVKEDTFELSLAVHKSRTYNIDSDIGRGAGFKNTERLVFDHLHALVLRRRLSYKVLVFFELHVLLFQNAHFRLRCFLFFFLFFVFFLLW